MDLPQPAKKKREVVANGSDPAMPPAAVTTPLVEPRVGLAATQHSPASTDRPSQHLADSFSIAEAMTKMGLTGTTIPDRAKGATVLEESSARSWILHLSTVLPLGGHRIVAVARKGPREVFSCG
jgi:hypothetical protein